MCLIRMIYVLIYHGPSPPQLPYVLFLCVALLHLVFPHSPLDSLECCENKPINALSISEKKSKTNVVLTQPERSTRKNTNTCDAQSTH